MDLHYGNVSSHISTAGFGGMAITGAEMHWAWMICLVALLMSLGFALLRFIPRAEK
jgi:hypothetical protein